MKIGFIGAGQMATALAAGMANKCERELEFLVYSPRAVSIEKLATACGPAANVTAMENTQAVVDDSDVVFLAVKPQMLEEAMEGINFESKSLVISIIGGADMYRLRRIVGHDRIVRTMPNTPCLIGMAATGYAVDEGVSDEDAALVEELFGAVGTILLVHDESLINSVAGVSGSGPAYVYTFIEAMIDGGVLVGLKREIARELAIQTVLGAAELMKETGKHPGELRDQVTSPGGTTIAALKALEETGMRDAVMSAVLVCTERAKEL